MTNLDWGGGEGKRHLATLSLNSNWKYYTYLGGRGRERGRKTVIGEQHQVFENIKHIYIFGREKGREEGREEGRGEERLSLNMKIKNISHIFI